MKRCEEKVMSKQLTIDFNPNIYAQFRSVRAFIDEHLIPEICSKRGTQRQLIAAELDYGPSHLKNKLVASDGAKFNTDDLESFMDRYGAMEVIRYYTSKYCYQSDAEEMEALRARLAELEGNNQQTESLKKVG